MLLRFLGGDLGSPYRGSRAGVEKPWHVDQDREVPEETAEYLLSCFPGCFEVVKPKVETTAEEKPKKSRAIKSPAKKRATTKKAKK
jgi:hypothetical protein